MRCESSGFSRNGVKRLIAAVAAFATLGAAGAGEAATAPIARFYNILTGAHFWTADMAERDKILQQYPQFKYEGIDFYASDQPAAGMSAIKRFYHSRNGTHFFTASDAEAAFIIANYPVYIAEGTAYYSPAASTTGTVGLHRFWNSKTGNHFYTPSPAERDYVLQTWPFFIYEGVAYYVTLNAPPGGGGNVAPKVDLTTSATTVGVPGAIMLSANATDQDGTIAKVQFFVNGAMLTEMASPPFAYAYTANAAGTFTFTAIAFDNLGATTTSNAIVVTATAGGGGNIAPKATLTTSVTTVAVPGTITMNVAATDDDGTVAKVQFYANGALLGEDASSPYSFAYNATVAGTIALSAIATDNLGATGASNIVTVTATGGGGGNIRPLVSMTSIPNPPNVQPNNPVILTATASDPDGTVAKVEFYNGTALVVTRTAPPYTYTYTPTVVGNTSWTAMAYDNLNATTTSNAITVNSNTTNPPPNVNPRVALSINNTLVTSVPTTLTLTATATVQVTGNTISRVGFFQNGVKLVDDTASPYTTTVNITAPGTYSFYADASDNQGNVGSTLLQTVVSKTTPPPVVTTDADIWRLLDQATFGASQAGAAQVIAQGGITAWVDNQLLLPMTTGFPDTKYNRIQLGTTPDCTTNNVPANSPQAQCNRDHLTLAMIQRDFFTQAIYAPDQLRHRVAWALHQIVVTSGAEPDLAFAYVTSRYQKIFWEEAFANYRNILWRVSMSPAMGNYLDSVNNDKPDPNIGRVPNENYAREIMQLFSVGLEELNSDGSLLLDANNNPIPTYDQTDIAEVARVFTGWTYPRAAGTTTGKNPRYYVGNMVPYPITATAGHDVGAKNVLSGVTIPAGQTIQQDMDSMVDNVFLHPNTPVYIGRQLIQSLVTGDPSPAYVQRIAAVFANNGLGVRGDLKAVVRAVLLDPEARGGPKADPLWGKLKEPVLMLTGMIRALDGITDGAALEGRANTLGQRPFYSPTVFNYFMQDDSIPGTSIRSREFGIHNTNTAVSRTNTVYNLIYGNGIGVDQNLDGAMGTRFNLGQFDALVDNANALVNRVNEVLLGGQFPATSLPSVEAAVNVIPIVAGTTQYRIDRIRMAVHLMASSFHYQVQR